MPGLDIQRIPEGVYRIGCWVGTNENVRLKLLDAVGLKRSGRGAVFNSLQPDITAAGWDSLSRAAKNAGEQGMPSGVLSSGRYWPLQVSAI